MTGVFACNDERWISGGGGGQFEPHRHPAHGPPQLLQAPATFLRPLGGLHRVCLPQLRLPRDFRRNRCYLVVKSVRGVIRVTALCYYCTRALRGCTCVCKSTEPILSTVTWMLMRRITSMLYRG